MLSYIKHILKEDAGLDLNFVKTNILVKGISAADAHASAQRMLASLIRFCQATRLQYLNGQIDLANQKCLQQQHVDWKISNALLKKGTREAYKT